MVEAQSCARPGAPPQNLGAGAGVRTSAPPPEEAPPEWAGAGRWTEIESLKHLKGEVGRNSKSVEPEQLPGRPLKLVPTHTSVLHNKLYANGRVSQN